MVIDGDLPLGLIANSAAVLGITLGEQHADIVGPDVLDKTGQCHMGITKLTIPILKGNKALIKELREKLYHAEFSEVTVVDFCDVAQICKTYNDFTEKISHLPEEDLNYLGVALYGDKKLINKLTGAIPLLR